MGLQFPWGGNNDVHLGPVPGAGHQVARRRYFVVLVGLDEVRLLFRSRSKSNGGTNFELEDVTVFFENLQDLQIDCL